MKCPTCGAPVKWEENPFRPFCSERCKLIDFGRWANGEYFVPGEEKPLTDTDATGQTSRDALQAPAEDE